MFDDRDLIATHTDQTVVTHGPDTCVGYHCCVHSPSDHRLRDRPLHWRGDRGIMERICEHGVGHPDPDGLDHIARTRGEHAMRNESFHGCDGCCFEPDGKP